MPPTMPMTGCPVASTRSNGTSWRGMRAPFSRTRRQAGMGGISAGSLSSMGHPKKHRAALLADTTLRSGRNTTTPAPRWVISARDPASRSAMALRARSTSCRRRSDTRAL